MELMRDNSGSTKNERSNCWDCEYDIFNPDREQKASKLNAGRPTGDIVNENAQAIIKIVMILMTLEYCRDIQDRIDGHQDIGTSHH